MSSTGEKFIKKNFHYEGVVKKRINHVFYEDIDVTERVPIKEKKPPEPEILDNYRYYESKKLRHRAGSIVKHQRLSNPVGKETPFERSSYKEYQTNTSYVRKRPKIDSYDDKNTFEKTQIKISERSRNLKDIYGDKNSKTIQFDTSQRLNKPGLYSSNTITNQRNALKRNILGKSAYTLKSGTGIGQNRNERKQVINKISITEKKQVVNKRKPIVNMNKEGKENERKQYINKTNQNQKIIDYKQKRNEVKQNRNRVQNQSINKEEQKINEKEKNENQNINNNEINQNTNNEQQNINMNEKMQNMKEKPENINLEEQQNMNMNMGEININQKEQINMAQNQNYEGDLVQNQNTVGQNFNLMQIQNQNQQNNLNFIQNMPKEEGINIVPYPNQQGSLMQNINQQKDFNLVGNSNSNLGMGQNPNLMENQYQNSKMNSRHHIYSQSAANLDSNKYELIMDPNQGQILPFYPMGQQQPNYQVFCPTCGKPKKPKQHERMGSLDQMRKSVSREIIGEQSPQGDYVIRYSTEKDISVPGEYQFQMQGQGSEAQQRFEQNLSGSKGYFCPIHGYGYV